MLTRILICEDEENIVSFLETELRFEGFETDTAFDGDKALALFAANEYSLVLLDIMLPAKNGLECLREIRKTSDVPVVILTARKEVYDKVAFLTAGADDYITKPFDTMELVARIKRHIQRTEKRAGHQVANELDIRLTIKKEGYLASIGKTDLQLTKTEFEILAYLHESAGKVRTRDEIIGAVFGEFYGESNVIDVNVKNIRAKIARLSDAQIIETVRGKGYVIRNG